MSNGSAWHASSMARAHASHGPEGVGLARNVVPLVLCLLGGHGPGLRPARHHGLIFWLGRSNEHGTSTVSASLWPAKCRQREGEGDGMRRWRWQRCRRPLAGSRRLRAPRREPLLFLGVPAVLQRRPHSREGNKRPHLRSQPSADEQSGQSRGWSGKARGVGAEFGLRESAREGTETPRPRAPRKATTLRLRLQEKSAGVRRRGGQVGDVDRALGGWGARRKRGPLAGQSWHRPSTKLRVVPC
jgi:hypothetical protein